MSTNIAEESTPVDNIAKFQVDDWTKLNRLICIGCEGNTYYSTSKQLTIDNMKSALTLIKREGVKVVNLVVEISDSGRGIKNDPAIAVLAMAAAHGDEATRKAALAAVPKVCRIGTHMYQFAEMVQSFRGWGRGVRNAVGKFFTDRSVEKLAMQVLKYQARNVSEGDKARWSAKDLLILSHPKIKNDNQSENRKILFDYIMDRDEKAIAASKANGHNVLSKIEAAKKLPILKDFESLKVETDIKKIVQVIEKHKFPRECVPTQFQQNSEVQEALLDNGIGATALIRNLGNMSASGLLQSGSKGASKVISKLRDMQYLKSGRIHPIHILMAMKQYAAGHGLKSSKTWEVNADVVDALDEAFYNSFGLIEPSNKKQLLALDVSGSMSYSGNVGGIPDFTPREASAAMALITKATEKENAIIHGFSSTFVPINISPKQRLNDAVKAVSDLPFAGTDCGLPMKYALAKNLEVEAFVVYTDSETMGNPMAELRKYREKTGIPAKLIVVGMVANNVSICDPNDAGTLNVSGFDAGVPQVIANFIKE